MEYVDRSFADSRQELDGNHYTNCRFDRCDISYRGGEIPNIVDCKFDDCNWHFEDAAERTLAFMHYLYHGTGESGREMIEQTFELIRQPAP
jgi:hypothetical protein